MNLARELNGNEMENGMGMEQEHNGIFLTHTMYDKMVRPA